MHDSTAEGLLDSDAEASSFLGPPLAGALGQL
jgi:hypothetical protein